MKTGHAKTAVSVSNTSDHEPSDGKKTTGKLFKLNLDMLRIWMGNAIGHCVELILFLGQLCNFPSKDHMGQYSSGTTCSAHARVQWSSSIPLFDLCLHKVVKQAVSYVPATACKVLSCSECVVPVFRNLRTDLCAEGAM